MARISDLLAAGRTYSFEFFPPKDDDEHARLVGALLELQPLRPSFVSVTYRGGRASRRRTVDLVTGMLRTTTLTPMAHLVCVDHSRLELAEILVELRRGGVDNLMALRGDALAGGDGADDELRHADELVDLARAIGGFSIGVAAHPAGHPASPDLATDRSHLAAKLRRADFAVTQTLFRLSDYAGLVEDLSARGVDKPVVPGIMPVTTIGSISRNAALGSPVPAEVADRLLALDGDPAAVRAAGIDMATELCRQLLDVGAPGLHFYTLNRSPATREIYANLGLEVAAA